MGEGDAEMEDVGKHNHDSRNNIQNPEDQQLDGLTDSKEENLLPLISVSVDANKTEFCQNDPEKRSSEAKNDSSIMSGMEGQIKQKCVASELKDTGNSVEEPVNGARSKTEKGSCDEKSSNLMEKKPVEDFSGKRDKEIGNGDPNQSKILGKEVLQRPEKDEEMKDVASVIDEKEFSDELKELNKLTSISAVETSARQAGTTDVENTNKNQEDKDRVKEQNSEIAVTAVEIAAEHASDVASVPNQQEPVTPISHVKISPAMDGDQIGETAKTIYTQASFPLLAESDDGTPDEQAAFMKEIENFYRERAIDFKAPKFYGQPLNCLKLWRSVIRLGGYDRVTGAKLWRQVGESFHPPKTCTTVSWTFRIFYEKSLLEYERYKTQNGDLQFPVAMPEASGIDSELVALGNGHQGGSGRARRDAAARAMQGWHTQGILGHGEGGEPVVKDKNLGNVAKREKNLKSIGSMKQRRPSEMEHSVKAARTETSRQLQTAIVDIGPPADWVKINIRQTKDCFEVYALVPGLLREEVRVQSDPAGRLVITGQPEQIDNPWGVTPFKKVVSLPARIDPLQTSAVVSLHGRLFVRVPFEQSNN